MAVQQLGAVWSALSMQKRVVAVLATVAMFAAVLFLSRVATQPSMALLYAGLEPAAAGEVVAALEQQGVVHEVRGGAIYVEGGRRDELRLTLAANGLPANGGAGYELLDSLSGFGTTAQMFDAAYWRAKEGELARTIAASPAVRSARVHIAAASQGFRRDLKPSASVALVPAGEAISPQQARAVRFLVASAVAGLAAEAVSVIDAESGLVLGGEDDGLAPGGDPDRAAALKRNVERLLEARVGQGRAIVEVSIDTTTEREQITERRFDPDTRVAISTESEETTGQSSDAAAGAVTVASNLPAGDAGAEGARSSSRTSETRERVNYEVSETQREVLRGPGGVRRLTVAVLVDGLRQPDAAGGETWQPRPEEELAALRDLVASAVGYDEARGDVITLKSLPFEPASPLGSEAAGSALGGVDLGALLPLALLGAVVLGLGLFVVRPILAPRGLPAPALGPRRELAPPPLAPLGAAAGLGAAGAGGQIFTGEIDDGTFPGAAFPAVNSALPALGAGVDPAAGAAFDPDDPVARLRRLIAERQDETAEILRSWMDDREERV
jgi:flagellar M-ring protein FliF